MNQQAATVPGRLRSAAGSFALPAAMLGGAIVVLGGVALLSQQVGHEETRPEPPAFVNPVPSGPKRYIVKQANGTALSLVEESSKDPANATETPLSTASRSIETLRPIAAGDLREGDWVAVAGVPNAVRNFAIHALIVMPAGSARSDGIARSASGFSGAEASPSAADQVILSGPIANVSASGFVITGGVSPVRIDLTSQSPLFRLEPAKAAEIQNGDLVAIGGSGASDPTAPLLFRASVDRK